jgi:hypothetical protein
LSGAMKQNEKVLPLLSKIADEESVTVDRLLELVGSVAYVNKLDWFTTICHQ